MYQLPKIECRALSKFWRKEGLTSKIIKEKLDDVYGRSLRIGLESLEDDAKSERPEEVVTDGKVAPMERLILC